MFTTASDAYLAQRDASRKLYFIAVGCLHHPKAHLVAETDPAALPTLQQMAESGLKFAELSEVEQEEFRRRAVASTQVIKTGEGHQFAPPDRPSRRRPAAFNWAKVAVRGALLLAVAAALASLDDWLIGILNG